jgi:hypothetical protein
MKRIEDTKVLKNSNDGKKSDQKEASPKKMTRQKGEVGGKENIDPKQ